MSELFRQVNLESWVLRVRADASANALYHLGRMHRGKGDERGKGVYEVVLERRKG